MIAHIVTDADGIPLDAGGNKLSESSYNPPEEIKKLFARVQEDYNAAWRLQHRGFDEFDGYSLLDRARMDQQTFGAYVGATQEVAQKQWRWKGRKNTARNKVIGILAHVISGMLYPMAHAYNENDEEDEMTARVMRILIENHLKKADYEMKFLFMMTSALVNPAVFVEIEYVEALQKIKVRNPDGSYRVEQAVDELLSGINLNIIPIDQILLADFYTFDLQRQPNIPRVRRISYDEAREIYGNGKYMLDGVDQFNFVEAGKTRILMTGQEHQTLYDIEWTEADANYVQELTLYYRPEDLEVTFVGGVFMGEYKDIYNSNCFKHRRMSMIGDEWKSIPVYPFAKTGFEPLDPAGRFAYYKSACFKLFWDAIGNDRMHQLAYDASYLDTIKPIFMTGVAKVDSTVMVPGATIGMPLGANVTPYSMSPNIPAVMNMMRQEQEDMSESTQDKSMSGVTDPNVTATAVLKAEQSAKVIMQVFAVMIVDLVTQIGELVVDDIIAHETIGSVDAQTGKLNMKYKAILLKGKDSGKDVTNKIQFTTDLMGVDDKNQLNKMEWEMFEKAGGMESNQRIFKVNPYKFARTRFNVRIDAEQIISRSMGTDQLKKERAFTLLTDPRVAPYVNQQAVVDKFVLEEFSDGNPDEFKKKAGNLLDTVMGQSPGAVPSPIQPQQQPLLTQ